MEENRGTGYLCVTNILRCVSLTFPLLIIGAPSWCIGLVAVFIFSPLIFRSANLVVITEYAYDFGRPILYIWAVVAAIMDPQDVIAIIFYIFAALQVLNMFKRICFAVVLLAHKEN